MAEKPPVVLTIAGFDPSSGAGITADIKTMAAHGCYGLACVTAVTVQSTSGVRRVESVDPLLVTDTLEELAEDIEIAAVHIGMLRSAKVVKAVADFLSSSRGRRGGGPGERAGSAGRRKRVAPSAHASVSPGGARPGATLRRPSGANDRQRLPG